MVPIPSCPLLTLSDGNRIPLIGLGTWKSTPGQVYEAVKCAIECGYRHIDCAYSYLNEAEVGNAIRDKIDDGTIDRENIFVTAKAWNTFHRKEKVVEALKGSLKDLQLDYVDLYLVHWPMAFKYGSDRFPMDENKKVLTENIDLTETWQGMEECVEKGLTKSIGLSNYNHQQIQRVIDNCTIKPVMLQVECHPYLNQNKLIDFCKKHDIAIAAYSPLGSPARIGASENDPILLEDEKVKRFASKYNKTPAQILLRYNVQRDVVVLPKSVTPERLLSNFKIFDFELTQDEMNELNSFNKQFRYIDAGWLKDLPEYPFLIEY